MTRYLSKSLLLLSISVVLCCIVYTLALWAAGQAFFPFQANGSIIDGPDGRPVGSKLIAQPFNSDEYFHPRPSAASYDASASASSSLAASNYALRDRAARAIAPVAAYRSGLKAGLPVAPDVERWFREDTCQGRPHIVAQWATLHPSQAQAWVKADPANAAYVDDWAKTHPDRVADFIEANPSLPDPTAPDLAVMFFQDFSTEYPGKFPAAVSRTGEDGKAATVVEPVGEGPDIQSIFFLMWREDHPDANIKDVPGDMVTASGSGLDPHITLQNAKFQLDRVASAWATDLKRDPGPIRAEIERVLNRNAAAPLSGLAGERYINVLEVNLELRKLYGKPS